MNRPHVICHMVTSIDGKVTVELQKGALINDI